MASSLFSRLFSSSNNTKASVAKPVSKTSASCKSPLPPLDLPAVSIDFSRQEEKARRYAEAFVAPSFFETIAQVKGKVICGWYVDSVFAIGGSGVLYAVHKQGGRGLLKMPRLPYHKPIAFGSREMRAQRKLIDFESEILTQFSQELFPRVLEVCTGPNPLLHNRSERLANHESYFVMELLEGRALDEELRVRFSTQDRAQVLFQLSVWIEQLLRSLLRLQAGAPSLFYTDFKPANVLVCPDNRAVLLDAGSVTFFQAPHGVPVSEGYGVAPQRPQELQPAELERISLLSLGRTIYASALHKVLYEGYRFELSPILDALGIGLGDWTFRAAMGEFSSCEESLHFLLAVKKKQGW